MNFTTHHNELTVLFIGDIVARPGRRSVETILPQLIIDNNIDLVIANAENISGGRGVNEKSLLEMNNAGVNYFTSGDHVFRTNGYEKLLIDQTYGLLRPANYNGEMPGSGVITFTTHNGVLVTLINLQGEVFMREPVLNPFIKFDELYKDVPEGSIVLVDLHAEATSEKKAFGNYVDGRAHGVFGTHTHVPTSDLQVLPNGTFYVTDAGMVGSQNSVLGVKTDIIVDRFVEGRTDPFVWEYEGPKVFNSIKVGFDKKGMIT